MRKLKFNVGDVVLPTNRAPKCLVDSANFTRPKVVQGKNYEIVYGRYRNVYLIGGLCAFKTAFLPEELKLVKRKK